MWNQKKKPHRNRDQICDYQKQEVCVQVGVGDNWVKTVKKYKLPVIRYIISEDVMYSRMTTVNDTTLYI